MAKKILVAVDESKNSMNAVKYVAGGMEKTGTVTLFSVLPDATAACGLDSPALTPLFKQSRKTFCAIEDTKKDREGQAGLGQRRFPFEEHSCQDSQKESRYFQRHFERG